jgi:hypothetical protein
MLDANANNAAAATVTRPIGYASSGPRVTLAQTTKRILFDFFSIEQLIALFIANLPSIKTFDMRFNRFNCCQVKPGGVASIKSTTSDSSLALEPNPTKSAGP